MLREHFQQIQIDIARAHWAWACVWDHAGIDGTVLGRDTTAQGEVR